MLWLGFYFPQLPLSIFAGEQTVPLAVTRREKGRDLIDRCNELARAQGIHAGMPLNTALSLLSSLQVRERDRAREQQQLEALAGWAWQYSSRISFDPLLMLLEVGASLKLFGGFSSLLERMQQEQPAAADLQHWALAPSPSAAALLARYRPKARITDPGQLPGQLADIPLQRLTRRRQVLELMQGIGLSSIGDCLQLPRPELARRVEPEFVLLLDRLLGRAPDPRPLWQPPEVFEQRLLLLHEIGQASALLFPARRLVESLCGFLRGRDGAAQRLQWQFLHRDAPPTPLAQGMLAPGREVEYMLEIFRQSLERLSLPEAVVEMVLRVDDWQAFQEQAGDLFDSGAGAQDNSFLERLRARMGSEAVQGIQVHPDHRPEHAWRYCEPLEKAGRGQAVSASHGHQPIWLLPKPQSLPVRRGCPCYRGELRLQVFSQRIESGWWDDADVARDYYRASNSSGQQLWIYRDRRSGRWFLQGFFD